MSVDLSILLISTRITPNKIIAAIVIVVIILIVIGFLLARARRRPSG
ncbi:MAG: hypothetical protein ACREQM_21100 [Candidatus Dormibacteraceae bacterium]